MFAIYAKLGDSRTHKFARRVDGLGGQAGPFAERIRSASARSEVANHTLRWHLGEADLLAHYLT